MDVCTVKPIENQILTHISNPPFELIDFCRDNEILTEAYSPIAHGEALKNEEIDRMAEKYGVTAAAEKYSCRCFLFGRGVVR